MAKTQYPSVPDKEYGSFSVPSLQDFVGGAFMPSASREALLKKGPTSLPDCW